MSINKLYNQAREVPEALYNKNKYAYFSQYNLVEIKYLDINDVLADANTELKHFIAEFKQILLFPNKVNGRIVDITIRSLDNKGHLKLGNHSFPYGIGDISKDFKYGDTIYLVEGIGDYIALKLINPDINIVAMQSAAMSKHHVNFLKNITNNYVLFRDNDEAGKTGAYRMGFEFKKNNLNLKVETSFSSYNFKDIGDLLDLLIEYGITKDKSVLTKIETFKKYYEIKTKER